MGRIKKKKKIPVGQLEGVRQHVERFLQLRDLDTVPRPGLIRHIVERNRLPDATVWMDRSPGAKTTRKQQENSSFSVRHIYVLVCVKVGVFCWQTCWCAASKSEKQQQQQQPKTATIMTTTNKKHPCMIHGVLVQIRHTCTSCHSLTQTGGNDKEATNNSRVRNGHTCHN